jgi:hypothetical protein
MPPVRDLIVRTIAVLAILATGCKDDGGGITNVAGDPGIRFVAGAGATDTVDASLLRALTIEVRVEQGRLVPDATVRFTSVPSPSPFTYPVYVAPLDATFLQNSLAVDTTDERGRASALIRLGNRAGSARVAVTVPEMGLTDTTTYTVRPGVGVKVLALPKDTSLYPGRTATLRSAVADRYGNLRTDAVSYERVSGPVTIQGAAVTSTQDYGVAKVVARSGGATDTTTINVVPSGTIAFSIGPSGVGTVNLDGSNYRVVTTSPSAYVRWAPNGSTIAFDNYYSVPARITTLDGVLRAVRASSPNSEAEMYPVYSPDGAWVYLSVASNGQFRLWRARADGTEAAPLNSLSPDDDFFPSPSPDGTKLAYVLRTGGGTDLLRILDLATGEVNKLTVRGHAPAWSPLGDLIAYVDLSAQSAVRVMRPDGTGHRQISVSNGFQLALSWSPDGKWVIGFGGNPARVRLIEVATGQELALSFSNQMTAPDWKR